VSDPEVWWCEGCARGVPATEVGEQGECPACGQPIAARRRVPWHLKLMLVATAVYLAWRIYQGMVWLAHHV